MIKFFRRIRYNLMEKNKTGKYLKYAIGEIVLVVIGILIALQINNWNEERKAKLSENATLRNFVQDLRSDSSSFSINLNIFKDINALHQQLYEIGVKGIDTIFPERTGFIRRLPYYNPIAKENDPQITSKISNDSIRKAVLNYFRAMKDLDDTYGEFQDLVRERMRVFLADNNLHNLSAWFESEKRLNYVNHNQKIINPEDLVKISKNPEFQQLLLEASLKVNETITVLNVLMDNNEKLINLIENSLRQK